MADAFPRKKCALRLAPRTAPLRFAPPALREELRVEKRRIRQNKNSRKRKYQKKLLKRRERKKKEVELREGLCSPPCSVSSRPGRYGCLSGSREKACGLGLNGPRNLRGGSVVAVFWRGEDALALGLSLSLSVYVYLSPGRALLISLDGSGAQRAGDLHCFPNH